MNRPQRDATGAGHTQLAKERSQIIDPIVTPSVAIETARESLKYRTRALDIFNQAIEELTNLIRPSNVSDIVAMAMFWDTFCDADEDIASLGITITSEKGERYANPCVKIRRDAHSDFERIKKQYGLTLDSRIRLGLNAAAAGSLVETQNKNLALDIVKALMQVKK